MRQSFFPHRSSAVFHSSNFVPFSLEENVMLVFIFQLTIQKKKNALTGYLCLSDLEITSKED